MRRKLEGPLTPKQHRAIESLLVAGSHAEAAKSAQVPLRTLQSWLTEPEFVKEYKRLQRLASEEFATQVGVAAKDALSTLKRNLTCGSPGVEVRAALGLMRNVIDFKELQGLNERLDAIERRREEQESAASGPPGATWGSGAAGPGAYTWPETVPVAPAVGSDVPIPGAEPDPSPASALSPEHVPSGESVVPCLAGETLGTALKPLSDRLAFSDTGEQKRPGDAGALSLVWLRACELIAGFGVKVSWRNECATCCIRPVFCRKSRSIAIVSGRWGTRGSVGCRCHSCRRWPARRAPRSRAQRGPRDSAPRPVGGPASSLPGWGGVSRTRRRECAFDHRLPRRTAAVRVLVRRLDPFFAFFVAMSVSLSLTPNLNRVNYPSEVDK